MAASVGQSGQRDDNPTAKGCKPTITPQMIKPLPNGYMADFKKVQRKGKTVYQGFLEANPKLLVAAKKIKPFSPDVDKKFDKVLQTFLISHENIVSVLNHFILEAEPKIGPSFWIITEYCDSHLLQFIKNNCGNKPMDPMMASEIMVGCTNGMAFLHSQEPPVIHRNIHPFNILMKEENGKDVVKIADCLISEVFENQVERNSIRTATESGYLGIFRKCYTAPEYYPAEIVPQERAYDTFVLGVLFHALLSYKHESIKNASALVPQLPENLHLEKDRVLIGKYISNCEEKNEQPSLFNSDSAEVDTLQNVVRGMLRYKPEERKSLPDIVKELNRLYCTEPTSTMQQQESAAGSRTYEFLTGEKHQEKLEELVDEFEETLGKSAPVYIQHLDASTKYFRINVSIDEGKEREADEFFRSHCESFYRYIYPVSQKSKPKFLCGHLPGVKPLVESGSMLICAPPDKAEAIEQSGSFREIIQPDVDGSTTFFTLGCFATDTFSEKHYAITAKHCLDHAVGNSNTMHYSIYSAFKNQGQNVIPRVLSQRNVNNVIGMYGNENVNGVTKLVDIAICELSHAFLQSVEKFWYIRRDPWFHNDGPIHVIHRLDDTILKCVKVRKHGAQTGHTSGVIVRDNKRMRISDGSFGRGSCLIQSNQVGGVFANEGDSGALVLDSTHEANAWALGLVSQSQENYMEADSGCQSNVTFFVRLKHCLYAVNYANGMNLRVMNLD